MRLGLKMWLNKCSSSHGEHDSSYKLLAETGLTFLRLAVDIPSYFYIFPPDIVS